MNPVPKEQNEHEEMIRAWLKKGNKITHCEPGARTEDIDYKGGFYAKRKKKKEAKERGDDI